MISKGLYALPAGDTDSPEEDHLEAVEIDEGIAALGPDTVVLLDDGSAEVVLDAEDEGGLCGAEFGDNLVEFLPERVVQALSSDLQESVDADIAARKEWADTYIKGMEVLGFKYEERNGRIPTSRVWKCSGSSMRSARSRGTVRPGCSLPCWLRR